MLEPPARIRAQFVHVNCFLRGENSPADPRGLGGSWVPHTHPCGTNVWISRSLLRKPSKDVLPKPKGGKTRRGPQRVESLRSGGLHEQYCCVPGTQHQLGTWAIILGTLLSKGVPDPIVGRLFILSGLGLPGTGYQSDQKARNFPGKRTRASHESKGAMDWTGLGAGQL